MQKLIKLTTVLTFIAIGISCEPDPVTETIEDATIVWGGDTNSDGCGWLISMHDSIYKPDEIPAGFEVNNLPVSINYQKLNSKYICSWSLGMTNIHIKKIILRQKNN